MIYNNYTANFYNLLRGKKGRSDENDRGKNIEVF